MELKGSKTEQNLWAAFAGESQARNKYDYFASRAKKDGYEQIAAIFQETALNEKEHAKMWFKEVAGIGDTPANLAAAAAGQFLGLGVAAPHPEWGLLLSEGRQFMRVNPELTMFPGLAIMITVLALNLIGDGIRDALDPKLRR